VNCLQSKLIGFRHSCSEIWWMRGNRRGMLSCTRATFLRMTSRSTTSGSTSTHSKVLLFKHSRSVTVHQQRLVPSLTHHHPAQPGQAVHNLGLLSRPGCLREAPGCLRRAPFPRVRHDTAHPRPGTVHPGATAPTWLVHLGFPRRATSHSQHLLVRISSCCDLMLHGNYSDNVLVVSSLPDHWE